MKYIYNYLFILLISGTVSAQLQGRKVFTTTPVYTDIILAYKQAIANKPHFKWVEAGTTDVGKPLNLLIISKDKIFDPVAIRKQQKAVLFINNGIHPGEPEGIDACIALINDFAKQPNLIPDNVVICIIPVYNIDGCLNRGTSRVNQNGPEAYGFRGNAKNLDLNRDLIKCDAENSKSFIKLFRLWEPAVFLDTHTSNGADYQHVLTLIATQHSKLAPSLAAYLNAQLLPALYTSMKKKKYELCPYVDTFKDTPESGLVGFMDSPRYTTGYSTLFNTIGFVSETHMWKPYNERVWATYDFIYSLIDKVNTDAKKIVEAQQQANVNCQQQVRFPLNWKLDTTRYDSIIFRGYEPKHKISKVTGLQRLYYDRSAPFTKKINYYNYYQPVLTVEKPLYYLVPQGWKEVIERLTLNKVTMKRLLKDTVITGEVYYITGFKTGNNPYEHHYLHHSVQVRKDTQALLFYKGDYLIETNQTSNRYIVETIEPQGVDSYFAWGFFDAILQQKEYFSDYIFEENAEEILEQNPGLKQQLSQKQKNDSTFAKSSWQQLLFIYQNSNYYEKSHKRYPVMRLNQPVKLPVN